MSDDPVKAALDAGLTLPPPGWSARAKAEWPNLPECLRADIAKREAEMDAGMRRYSGLGRFVEEAERNGTTLASEIENMRRLLLAFGEDPHKGMTVLCFRYDLDPKAIAEGLLRRSEERKKEGS